MTDAQWKVKLEQISAESKWNDRAFRKWCVTQNIVTFNRDKDDIFYTVNNNEYGDVEIINIALLLKGALFDYEQFQNICQMLE